MTFHADVTHFGWIGVQLFFVLSGFLITGILWKEKFNETSLSHKFKKFWIRRSLRIFPLYIGYLVLLGIIYLWKHLPANYEAYFPYLFTYTFNFTRSSANWQGDPAFTHLWSLSIEEQFYLIFPLVLFLCSSRFIKNFMVVIIVLSPITRFLLGLYYGSKGLNSMVIADSIYWNTLSHLDAFFIGGIIPVFSLHEKIKKPTYLLTGSLLIALISGLINYLNSNSGAFYFNDLGFNHGSIKNYEHVWHYTVLNIFFASLLLTLVSVHSRSVSLHKFLENKWMVRIGKVSYGMYVFHWGLLAYVLNFFSAESNLIKIILFVPYVILVYLIAELSFRVYESHFIKLKDRLFPDIRKKKGNLQVIENYLSSNKTI